MPTIPKELGDFEILEEIGRGGMGVIHRARQKSLGRIVALKLLNTQGTEASHARLRQEAIAAARLEHPNIVRVYEVGEVDGRIFIAMQWVDGLDLDQLARRVDWDSQRIAKTIAVVARAIHAAHEKEILHRDIKPANIVIDAEGVPHVTDFGLAKQLDRSGQLTGDMAAGTPNFLAPEQASHRFGATGIGTDVHGLGATLYFLLTWRPPFRGETLADTLRAVTDLDPVPPRHYRPGVPKDLETICLRCLEKNPSRRYRSPLEVAEELERFVRDEPIVARPVGGLERFVRWCRRHPTVSALSASTVALLLALAVLAPISAIRIRRERDAAHLARQEAELSERTARQDAYHADMGLAAAALVDEDRTRARMLLDNHLPSPGRPDLRRLEWRLLDQALSRSNFVSFGEPAGACIRLTWLDGGRRVLFCDSQGYAHIRSWPDGKTILSRRVRDGLGTLYSANLQRGVLSVHQRTTTNAMWIRNYSLPDLEPAGDWSVPGFPLVQRHSSDGRELWLSEGASVVAADARTGQVRLSRTFSDGVGKANAVFDLSSDERLIALVGTNRSVEIRDARTGDWIRSFQGHENNPAFDFELMQLSFTPDGKYVLSSGSDATVRVWNLTTPATSAERILVCPPDIVSTFTIHPDGSRVAAIGRDDVLRIWDFPQRGKPRELACPPGLPSALAWHPTEDAMVVAYSDGNIFRIQLAESAGSGFHKLPSTQVSSVRLMPDHRHVFWYDSSGGGGMFDFESGESRWRHAVDPQVLEIGGIATSPGLRQVVRYERGGKIRILDASISNSPAVREWTEPRWSEVAKSADSSIEFSRDGSRLMVNDIFNGLRMYRVSNSTAIGTLPPLRWQAPVFSNDGKWVYCASPDGTNLLWEVESNRQILLRGLPGFSKSGDFSPSGDRLAIGNESGRVVILRLPSGETEFDIPRLSAGIISCAFSPDESRLVMGTIGGQLVILDILRRQELARVPAHQAPVLAVAFRPDGSLLSAASDGVRVWSTGPLAVDRRGSPRVSKPADP